CSNLSRSRISITPRRSARRRVLAKRTPTVVRVRSHPP
ncbi:MAG: hypothetical protein AVDCRST_MAG93-4202, partial [uncultured Chloroflexia bacterium]